MPISTCPKTIGKCTAIWTFVPYEEIDFNKYRFVKTLIIESYNPTKRVNTEHKNIINYNEIYPEYLPILNITSLCLYSRYYHMDFMRLYQMYYNPQNVIYNRESYILPSLTDKFPRLERLIIQNKNNNSVVYLSELTDIPHTVTDLVIENTMLSNIGSIISECPNIMSLKLNTNMYQIKITKLPINLRYLYIDTETLTEPIKVNPGLRIICISQSSIPGIENLKYVPNSYITIDSCESPYDNVLLSNPILRTIDRVYHINMVNRHRVYTDFGAIPHRIQISEKNINNPIVVALNLSSNYPRRMAEFIAKSP